MSDHHSPVLTLSGEDVFDHNRCLKMRFIEVAH